MIDAPESAAGTVSNLSFILVEILRPLVYGAVTTAGAAATAWFYRKFKIDASKTMSVIIELGMGYAEQEAHKRLKLGRPSMTSEEKLKLAVDFAEERAKAAGVPAWARKGIPKLVEAKLGMLSKAVDRATEALKDLTPALDAVGQSQSSQFKAPL